MQEANDEDNSNGEKPKAYGFEWYHFLELHIVLVDSHTIVLSLFDFVEYFIDILHCPIYLFWILFSRDVCNVW